VVFTNTDKSHRQSLLAPIETRKIKNNYQITGQASKLDSKIFGIKLLVRRVADFYCMYLSRVQIWRGAMIVGDPKRSRFVGRLVHVATNRVSGARTLLDVVRIQVVPVSPMLPATTRQGTFRQSGRWVWIVGYANRRQDRLVGLAASD